MHAASPSPSSSASSLIVLGAYFLLVVRDESKLLERLQPRERQQARPQAAACSRPRSALSTRRRRSTRCCGDPTGTRRPCRIFVEQSGVQDHVGDVPAGDRVCLAALGVPRRVPVHVQLLVRVAGRRRLAACCPYLLREARAHQAAATSSRSSFPKRSTWSRARCAPDTRCRPASAWWPTSCRRRSARSSASLYDEQNFGLTLPDALRNFARRIPVLDARFFVTAVLTQREAGGNLAEVLDNLAAVIRERFKVKRQVRVISAHGRITGWVLAGLPPSLAVASFIISPVPPADAAGRPARRQHDHGGASSCRCSAR